MSRLNIFITDLEYEFSCEWNHAEYPQIGDGLSILHICSEEQEKIFEQMPLPAYLNKEGIDYNNAAEYIDYCGFTVKSRSWGRKGILTIICKRDD